MAGSMIKKLFFVNKTWRINICRDIQQSGGEHAVVQERIIKSVHSLSSFLHIVLDLFMQEINGYLSHAR